MEENKVIETVEETAAPAETAPATHERHDRRPRGDRKGGPRRNDRRGREPEVKEFEERVVFINRVSKTVKGGRNTIYANKLFN